MRILVGSENLVCGDNFQVFSVVWDSFVPVGIGWFECIGVFFFVK